MTHGYLNKRSMRIEGHRTSVALEPEFWAALEGIVQELGTTMPQLIAAIDAAKPKEQSLASACRVYVLTEGRRADLKAAA